MPMAEAPMKRLLHILILAGVVGLADLIFIPRLYSLPPTPAQWKLGSHAVYKPVPAEFKTWRGTDGAVRVWRATYEGDPPIALTVYQMPWSPGGAWDAIQKWRPQPGKLAFAKSHYFGVAEAANASPETLKRFVESVTAGIAGRNMDLR
jgi:hypothetical protein